MIHKKNIQDAVTIVFSVFNEENNIHSKILNCLSLDYPQEKLHIVVASDGSTDRTSIILEEYSKKYNNFNCLVFSKQRGKAACINDAMEKVKTDYVVLTDVRQDFNKCAIKELLANFSDLTVGAVSGELQFKNNTSNDDKDSTGMDIYWHFEKFIRKNESRFNSSVGVTGAIYAIRTNLFIPIPESCILDDVLIPMNITKKKFRVVFEEKAVAYDIPSNDIIREKKRKTRTIAGNYQLVQLSPWLINPFSNKIFIQYFSHKLLRLVMPLFLLLLFVSNLYLYNIHITYQVFIFAQVIFYLIPMSTKLIPVPTFIAKGIKAFLSLNYFSILGFLEFVRNKNIHIWKQ